MFIAWCNTLPFPFNNVYSNLLKNILQQPSTNNEGPQKKVMKSFIPSTCGCVHVQHTVLCT